jgi:hypothetical protein
MIDTCDAVIAVLEDVIAEPDFLLLMDINDVKLGDPGFVMVDEYPYIYVEPQSEEQVTETMTRRGYDVTNQLIEIGIVINQADYFDETVSELSGLRELLKSASYIRKMLRSSTNRSLSGIARSVKVPLINYEPQERGDAFVALAKISLVVQRQYQHEE